MRKCGVLLHISSLAGNRGIGSFGKQAYKFVNFLRDSKQSYWQILPLGQTGYGDSPYQNFSVFAGNPYFIDLDLLVAEGLLVREDIAECDWQSDTVDYSGLYHYRYKTLKKIKFDRLDKKELEDFYQINAYWLDDYALFMAVKFANDGRPWEEWDEVIKFRKPAAIEEYSHRYAAETAFFKALQFLFFKQWSKLKHFAGENGIKIIGDMPIYAAYDSADVWTHPECFNLDGDLRMKTVAGCPPDFFSETGQLWGNPVYNWESMAEDNYAWWVKRLRFASEMYDRVRIDHFRGFASYYEIPYGDADASGGCWREGPRSSLFKVIAAEVPAADIIAEDLGHITGDVTDLMKETGFPGMKVLQFGASSDSPHNIKNITGSNYVVYTGTHDNTTARAWFEEAEDEYKAEARKLMPEFGCKNYAHALINLAYSSVCDTAIIPVQDILNLSGGARMNRPSTSGENWKWRLAQGALTKKVRDFLCGLAEKYNRV